LLQDLAQFLPFKQIERAHGAVALYTVKGQILLDSHATELAISETGFGQNWPPPPAVQSTQLQIKTGEGWQPIRPISGAGSLSATQDISLKWAPNLQAQTDQLAFKLSQIFSSLTEDTSLHGDNPGLFTDLGGRINADRLEGLASRLQINAGVNPDQGGQIWRMRDGVYAEHPAEDISGALLAEMADQLSMSQALDGNPSTSIIKDAQMITAQAHRLTNQAEENLVTQQAYLTLTETALAAHSVDTDIELQELLQIETAFAANAKMLQTVDEMMQEILRIGR
jgi:flagellar hook-associated protein 1 FlgK